MDDVLQVCGTGYDVTQRAACPPHGEQIRDWEVSQDLDEQFGGEIEEDVGWIGRCGDSG